MDDPMNAPGERFMIGTCDVKGKLDGAVVALVRNGPPPRYADIQRAWRVNLTAMRFDSISTAGIVCEEPGGAN
jgi:hypothetical protein